MPELIDKETAAELMARIREWAAELGFQQLGISDTELAPHEAHLLDWLAAGCHGSMDYMERHGTRRSRPAELLPGTAETAVEEAVLDELQRLRREPVEPAELSRARHVLLADWVVPAILKYTIILVTTVLVCLLTYDRLVRSTLIGVLINGRRHPR